MNTKKETNHNLNEDVTIAHRAEKHYAPARSAKKLGVRLKSFRLNVHADARHEH